MEVVHLGKYYPPEPGGMEQVLKGTAEGTASPSLSHRCLVADRGGRREVSEEFPGVRVHRLPEWFTFLLTPVVPSLPGELHRLRKADPEGVILLHYPNPMAVLALVLSLLLLPKRKGERLAVWGHADVLLEEGWKRALYALYRPLEEFLFRRTDAFLGATPNHVARLSVLSRHRERCFVVPYAIPDGWFDAVPGEEEAAARLRERIGGDFLLFVGRLVPYKGLRTVIEAAGRVTLPFVLAGTGPLEAELRAEAEARGVAGKVRFAGRVDDLRPYFRGCAALVLPSVSELEGFGVVQIEAMALGKPVVTSDLKTGVTWVNRHGETGLVFPAGDAEAFAEACNRLAADPALRSRLGERARERTRREFSYTALRREFAAFLDALRKGPSR